MLVSELSVVGRLAVSAGPDITVATEFEERKKDLRKSCQSTAYTYFYTVQILRRLQKIAKVVQHPQAIRALLGRLYKPGTIARGWWPWWSCRRKKRLGRRFMLLARTRKMLMN